MGGKPLGRPFPFEWTEHTKYIIKIGELVDKKTLHNWLGQRLWIRPAHFGRNHTPRLLSRQGWMSVTSTPSCQETHHHIWCVRPLKSACQSQHEEQRDVYQYSFSSRSNKTQSSIHIDEQVKSNGYKSKTLKIKITQYLGSCQFLCSRNDFSFRYQKKALFGGRFGTEALTSRCCCIQIKVHKCSSSSHSNKHVV